MPRYKWDKTPENRAERKKRILDSILQEAARAFNARGYHKTSLDDAGPLQNDLLDLSTHKVSIAEKGSL